MTAIRTQWQKIQGYIWLLLGVLCLFFALIFWAVTDKQELAEVGNVPESELELQIQPEKVAATTHLGALMDEVRPLELTNRVVASGDHNFEFRGTRFIDENKKASTVELFRVTEEDIIKSFLKKLPQRKDYYYIRLSGENQAEQYVLLYGLFKNSDEAKTAFARQNLVLPPSVKPVVRTIGQYAGLVNDLGADEMGLNSKLYEVRLRPAALPLIDESLLALPKPQPAAPATPGALSTTTTTVTRRDADGNVVDVQKSHSNTESKLVAPQSPVSAPE
ncbi:hypothetical protein CDG60_16730 [Acinetobacter chinensis]|uniref:SPOR domain-containing protein n=1 Tax=Acinetobacter chinensis TaxID=2004650 RepID=A0A3B7LYR2_9GAMM|nr:hypothetical protein [Acinetobacter chinensis]AXY58056.1 hypothetical protein CDG60_16730 [Acinetobacter chinensis]